MATNQQTSNIKFDLGAAVSSRLQAFTQARSQVQASDETRFYQEVGKGMSFADQLTFRKSQLDAEKARAVPDKDYIISLGKEVGTLTQQARFEAIRNDYKTALDSVVAGKASWEGYADHIQNLLDSNPDTEMQSELRSQLQEANSQVFQHTQNLINNEVQLAEQDKSLDLIDKAMNDVSSEKAKALGAGDKDRAALMDLKLSSLNQSKVDIQITTKANAMLVNKSRKASAVGYLQDLNDQVSSADSTTPIIYNGVHYDSEKAFWSLELNKYISTNFFNDLTTEYQKFNQSVSDVNGYVPDSVMKNIQSDFQHLASRPEIQPYLNRLSQVQSSTLADAVTKSANAILDRFGNDSDYTSALAQLQSLKDQYGIDVTRYANKVISDAAKDKGSAYNNMLSEVSARVAAGESYNTAVNEVFSAARDGSGKILATNPSNNDLVNKSPEELAREAPADTAKNLNAPTVTPSAPLNKTEPNAQQQANSSGQTPAQAAGLTPPAPAQNPAPTVAPTPSNIDLSGRYGVYNLNGNRTVYDKNQNKALSATDFKAQTGYDIADKNNSYKFDENYKPPTNVK